MICSVKKTLRRFAQDTQGNMTIEAVFFIPLMLTVLAATFSYYDAFRYKSLNIKASYTISDALSRETEVIDDDYMNGMMGILQFLTRSEGDYSLRVTQVIYKADIDEYQISWTTERGDFESMHQVEMGEIRDQLPTLVDNERVIVVETLTRYEPPLAVPGLDTSETFYNFSFTRPRFAPQLVWAGS